MKRSSGRWVPGGLATAVVCFFSIAIINGQATPQGGAQALSTEKPLMAEQGFKDVQLLRGISVKEFMETMGFFSAATGSNCTYCHDEESASGWTTTPSARLTNKQRGK